MYLQFRDNFTNLAKNSFDNLRCIHHDFVKKKIEQVALENKYIDLLVLR